MIDYRDNGDIYLGKIKLWDQWRQSPPRWLMMFYAVGGMASGWLAINGLHILLDTTL